MPPLDARRVAPWRLRDLPELPPRVRGGHLLVGNFDGVHIGHRKMVDRASALAGKHGGPVVAMTFEPHPQTVLYPSNGFSRLTEPSEKVRLLKEAGVDEVVTINFDKDLEALSCEAFALEVVSRHFDAKSIIVGRNFHFNGNQSGSAAQLEAIVQRVGLSVEIVPPSPTLEGDKTVTSSYIKSRLKLGDIEAVNQLLGRRWTLEGNVIHGDKRGRELGYPTANLAIRSDTRFGFGIYAVRLLINGHIANGVASYGTRPQFDDGAPRLEIHILDFVGDLYGAHLCVEFVAFQRPERVFSDVNALLRQMQVDCQEAKRLLRDNLHDPSIESVLERRMQFTEEAVAH
jgi:riboflavin kinase / FMN adenylyltransferase